MNPIYSPGDEITEGSLYRRVHPGPGCFPRGLDALPSNNKPDDPGISAYLVGVVTEEQVLAGHDGYALVEIDVVTLRNAQFRAVYAPKAEEGELGRGHVMINGDFRQSNCRALARACRLVRAGDPTKLRGSESVRGQ